MPKSQYRKSMREDIDLGPAGHVQTGTRGQEAEGLLRQLLPPFPLQQRIELGLERMQIEHVRRRVGHLLVGQGVGAPVGGLLLLGEVDTQQVAAKILEAEPVSEGTDEARRDLGAIDGLADAAQRMLEDGDVEATEMKELQ